MSFHLTSDESTLKVKDNHILRGRIKDKDGKLTDGSIDLNRFLGNKNGRFQWGGVNMSHTAEHVKFSVEHSVSILRAELRALDGSKKAADVNLAERVNNVNGKFEFV